MRFEISFTIGTFESAAEAYSLVMAHIKGPLNVIKSSFTFGAGKLLKESSGIENTLASPQEDWFMLHAGELGEGDEYPDVNSVSYWRDESYAMEVIMVIILDDYFFNIERFIFDASFKKFNLALLFESHKACWQREQFIAHFEMWEKSLEGRKLISHPYWADKVGLTVDIRDNPGRHIQTHNMMLMAAPDTWFGPGSWGYFEESDVTSFKGALNMLVVAPGTIYVKLFDRFAEDYEVSSILETQRAFRVCTKMDAIEEKLNSQLSFPVTY